MDLLKTLHPKTIGKYSIPFFANYYLDMDVPDHQVRWFDRIGQFRFNWLISPRGHGKTWTIPRVYAEHSTLYTPNFNVLLLAKTATQGLKNLELVDADLQNNDKLLTDFEYELSTYHRRNDQIWYNREKVQRDATIESAGLLGAITGGHFHLLLPDDLIDDANSRTDQSRQAPLDWFNGTVIPLLEPGGRVIGTGTRKHYDDMYQKLIDNRSWHVIEEKAILQWPKKWEFIYEVIDGKRVTTGVKNIIGNYKVLWPKKWPIEELLLELDVMGPIYFNREYQNDPSGLKGRILKEAWLRYYEPIVQEDGESYQSYIRRVKSWLGRFRIYMSVDVASEAKETADFTVITVFGIDAKEDFYVIDWIRDQIEFPEQVNLIVETAKKYNPLQIGIESTGYQRVLGQHLISTNFLPIVPVETGILDKNTRIINSSVHYYNGKVYLPTFHPQLRPFITEYSAFPSGATKDMLDSMDIGFRFSQYRTGDAYSQSEKKYEDSYPDDFEEDEYGI
ncbi:hypothetical protein [uncultured Methanobacterium sp.]|uniref:phage terminase large subunit family protein n=1 Tax=uncultured Methanobacterium sp. TaxID=176306 RepID=UPI002AA79716|nr:hypothetical protein [uncultured Methanobacterium sp.]